MKFKILSIILIIFSSVSAQKELWGMSNIITNIGDNNFGAIFKTDINGENRMLVHLFDEVEGKNPKARLFLASNGKLYGTAYHGGSFYSQANEGGVLFEYDLVFDRYRVVANFGGNGLTREPFTDLIEPVPGVLFGASLYRVFRYDIATETTTISISMPEYYNGNFNLANNVNNQFMKASDGFIYGATTAGGVGCGTNGSQAEGTIIKINPINNTFSQPYIFPCYTSENGHFPIGNLVEGTPGKLYGTTEIGGLFNDGVLFEFDIVTNTYIKIFDFNELVSGKSPRNLILGDNGNIYGITLFGGTNPCNPDQHLGTIFEYNITTNILTTVVNMGCDANFYGISNPHGTLLKASTGFIYGTNGYDFSERGIFRFDPTTNTAVNACPICNVPNIVPAFSEGLIEVCRKPSYPYIENDTYTICEEESFTYDLQNLNATSYTWKKNNQIIVSQTTGVLNLNNLEIADSGDYTCEMINECGTTVTMPIHLTVEACMGLDEEIGSKNAISLYPNPAQSAINIKLPENISPLITGVSIVNMLGQEVYFQSRLTTRIDITSLTSGLYILKLKTQKGNWDGKFIKQ